MIEPAGEEHVLSVEEFVDLIRPEIERQIDEWLLAQDPEDRPFLMRARARLIHEAVQATRIVNYKHRLEQAEAKLRPANAPVH